jgi:hypothetical protein
VAIAVLSVLLAAFLTARVLGASQPAGGFLRHHAAWDRVRAGPASALDVLLSPLSLLPAGPAEVLWAWWNAAALLLLLTVCRRAGRVYRVRAAWTWVPFLFVLRFAWDSMNSGEIHVTTALVATAGLLFAEIGRPGRAGLLLGLAGAIRPVTLLLVPFLLVRRRWRAAGLGAVAFLVLGVAIPAAVIGPGRFLETSVEAVERLARSPRPDGDSLRAMAHSVLHGTSAETLWLGAAAAALVLLGAFAARRGDGLRAPLVGGAALATLLLVAPDTERSMLVLTALPATAATFALARDGAGSPGARVAASLFGLAFLAASLPSRAIVGERAAKLLGSWHAGGFAALLLLATMWLLARVVGKRETGGGS